MSRIATCEPMARMKDARPRLAALSPREMDVAQLVITGTVSKLIAFQLGIAPKTVEVHRSRIMKKTGCRSMIEFGRLWEAALHETTRLEVGAPAAKARACCPMTSAA